MNAQSENDALAMRQLLTSWKLAHLERHFQAERISTEVLQMMNLQHVPVIMRGFPLGDQIRFESNLEQWRYNIGRPLTNNGATVTVLQNPAPATEPTIAASAAITLANSVATQTMSTSTPITKSSELQATEFSAPSPQVVQSALAAYALQETGAYQMDMRRILQSCKPLGPQLLRDYARSKRLKKSQRTELINMLARYFTDNGVHLSLHMSYALEREILKAFPTERLEDYRTERRGKIYMRVCNLKHYKNKSKRMRNEESEKEEKEKEQQRDQMARDSAGEELMSLSYSGEEDTLDSEKATSAQTMANDVVQLTSFQCDGFVVKQEFVDVGLGNDGF